MVVMVLLLHTHNHAPAAAFPAGHTRTPQAGLRHLHRLIKQRTRMGEPTVLGRRRQLSPPRASVTAWSRSEDRSFSRQFRQS
jgi:hypothetical protein